MDLRDEFKSASVQPPVLSSYGVRSFLSPTQFGIWKIEVKNRTSGILLIK